MKKKKVVDSKKAKKEKVTVKTYLKDFIEFLNAKLKKSTIILLIIAVVIFALIVPYAVSNIMNLLCTDSCEDKLNIGTQLYSNISVMLVTLIAGIVPYLYAPVVGFFGFIMNSIESFAYAIKFHGYFLGTLAGIIPLILNVISISLITSLAIYICNSVTISQKISNVSHMNSLNFRIKFYEMINKKQKQKELLNKKNKKLEVLKAKKEKIDFLQVINTTVVVILIQVISILIQKVLV